MISNKDKIIRIGIYGLLYVITILGIYFFIGRKINKVVAREKTILKKNKDKLEKQRALIISVPDYEKQLKEIKNKERAVNEKKFDKKELYFNSQLILTQKSSELGINIRSIKSVQEMFLEDRDISEGISKAYIEIILKTQFITLGKFFESLKGLPVKVLVEKVRIEKVSYGGEGFYNGRDNGDIIATIVFSSYAIMK